MMDSCVETGCGCRLILICGKMGAGKTTLSKSVASECSAVLISEDEWLSAHYSGQICSLKDYVLYSQKIKPFVKKHVQSILTTGVTVVLDFPANTIKQRAWLVSISNEIDVDHELLYLNVDDERCLTQIAKRRELQPERANFDTPQMYHEVTQYFEVPSATEGLNVIEKHSR